MNNRLFTALALMGASQYRPQPGSVADPRQYRRLVRRDQSLERLERCTGKQQTKRMNRLWCYQECISKQPIVNHCGRGL